MPEMMTTDVRAIMDRTPFDVAAVADLRELLNRDPSRYRTLREAVANIREREKKEPKPEPPVDPNVREVKDRLQRALGLKVSIEDKNGRGKVIIEYARLEDFDTLLEQLAGK